MVRDESPGTQLDPRNHVVSFQCSDNVAEPTAHEHWDSVNLKEKTGSRGVYQGSLNQLDMPEADLSLHGVNYYQRLVAAVSRHDGRIDQNNHLGVH